MRLLLTLTICVLSTSLVHAQNLGIGNDGSDKKFQGFNLQGYDDAGGKSWDVNGDSANVEGASITLSNVEANTYGERKMNVTAETGHINQENGYMRLKRDVVITSEDGSQLLTDSLDWDRAGDSVTTEDDVIITDDRFTATGKGIDAKPGLKTARIMEDVTVRVDTDSKATALGASPRYLTITSDGPMVINQAEQKATFEDNVVASQLDRTLKADKMEAYFAQDMGQIDKLICTGNVVIIQGENESYAQKATYDAVNQTVTLSGRPKLIMLTEGNNGSTAFGD